MELMALLLLWFDRWAYIYAGDPSQKGYVMVRVSNFMVFFLTSGVLFVFNLYLMDYLSHEGGMDKLPVRLHLIRALSIVGMLLAVVSAFTNLYYYFDESNLYHRGPAFLISYIIPVVCPLIQFTVIQQYRKIFGKLIYISLLLYIFVPLACGILQIFTYGISIVNMSMVAVSISLFLFTYIDINNEVEQAYEIEIQNMQGEKAKMQKLFDQTATAFVSAVEKKDDFAKGTSVKVAGYAKRIAQLSGKTPEECEQVYYAALLHDVGMIGIPDSVIKNDSDPKKWDYEMMRQKPLIGDEILSSITEYPYLGVGARYSHERYNGTGYPEGLKEEEIPEIARIIGVADAYVTMTSRKRYREARPDFMVREAFIKGSGVEFDPKFADIMVRIMDADSSEKTYHDIDQVESELSCNEYRDSISKGIAIEGFITRVTFECYAAPEAAASEAGQTGQIDPDFCVPGIILFDSYDRRVHDNKKAIEAYKYLEYGELWFDWHGISTAARKIQETILDKKDGQAGNHDHGHRYEIAMGRYEDHLKLLLKGPSYEKEVIVALPGGSTSAYLALTGEHCALKNIVVKQTDELVVKKDIPRIAEEISYIDRIESDVKNIQIDRPRSASTEGVELIDRLRIMFHTMSLPGANLIWHCPYVIIYSSDDGRVNGKHYREYALVELHGEYDGEYDYSHNHISVKKTEAFPGWDAWKKINKAGMECEILLKKKDNVITLKTRNLGIELENTTTVYDETGKVYVALTGDQVAITDIRVY